MSDHTPMLLSGNEAVALAAAHADVRMATGYPGTPSTEILETLAGFGKDDRVLRWAPNEKVALEVGLGSAMAKARTLVTMKHVGVNVAADPLMTGAYTGVIGGLVLISADDPGMHSSQNEQDNRHYARFAGIPMLEPADSQEAYDFTRLAYELSEQFGMIFMLRLTTRICHSKSLVHPGKPETLDRLYKFERDIPRYVMVPGNARKRHVVLDGIIAKLREWSEKAEINRVVGKAEGAPLGVVAAGVAYQYVREAAPEVPVFKLGVSWPLPLEQLRAFSETVDDVLVVEELTDFTLSELRLAGIKARGKHASFQLGELNPDRVSLIMDGKPSVTPKPDPNLPPPRPPVLCPGCGHRSVFAVLRKMKLLTVGDIGCYALGAMPPLSNLDTCICMGSGVTLPLGMQRVMKPEDSRNLVAVIGDSTFFHSGMTGVVDAVYNGSSSTLLVLDNRTTAMTGGQEHPGSGKRLDGTLAPALDVADVCRGLGVKDVTVLDAYDRADLEETLKRTTASDEYSVIVCRRPCLLLDRKAVRPKYEIDANTCTNCGACLRTGCPALKQDEKHVRIDPFHCAGCGLCFDVCKFNAIRLVQDGESDS